jgi:hypothetical protein
VTHVWRATLVVVSLATLGSGLGAQRRVLAFGLKAGHHAVRVHAYGAPGHAFSLWSPADTGARPLLIYVGDNRTALDTVLPDYLASHGYVVALLRGACGSEVAEAIRTAGALPFVDASHVAVARWGDPSGASVILDVDTRVLAIGTVPASGSGRARLRAALPRSTPQSSDARARRSRLLCALTHVALNAVLRGDPTLPEAARRLRAAGLATEIAPTP